MKRLLLAAMLVSGHAFAAEWVPLSYAGSVDQYFYDSSKLVIKDDEISYWKKVIYKTPQAVRDKVAVYGILRERIHCSEHSAKLMSYLYYSASGETIEYKAQDDSPATPVIPDSVGDAFERELCPMVWRRQEEMRIKAEQAGVEAELKQAPKKEEAGPGTPAPDVAPTGKQPEATLPLPQVMEQLY
jgi:hypothetical protein